MKTLVSFVFMFFSITTFGAETLKPIDFENAFEDVNSVETAERVYYGEIDGVDLYKVNFIFEKQVCVQNQYTQPSQSCNPTGEFVSECLYVFYDRVLTLIEPTEFTCDRDIEDVLPGSLYDGL